MPRLWQAIDVVRWDRQTDGRTPDPYINSASHTLRAASVIIVVIIMITNLQLCIRSVISCLCVTVTATESFVLRPYTEHRRLITKQSSVCFPVSVGRLVHRNVFSCCSMLQAPGVDRESPVADSLTGPRHDDFTRRGKHAVQVERVPFKRLSN